jgi:hypothetical protein
MPGNYDQALGFSKFKATPRARKAAGKGDRIQHQEQEERLSLHSQGRISAFSGLPGAQGWGSPRQNVPAVKENT